MRAVSLILVFLFLVTTITTQATYAEEVKVSFTVRNEPPRIENITESYAIVFDANGWDDIKEIRVYLNGEEISYSKEYIGCCTIKVTYSPSKSGNLTVYVIDNSGDSDSRSIEVEGSSGSSGFEASVYSLVVLPVVATVAGLNRKK